MALKKNQPFQKLRKDIKSVSLIKTEPVKKQIKNAMFW